MINLRINEEQGETTANVRELAYYDRKQIRNLKYFTWIFQIQPFLDDSNQGVHAHCYEDLCLDRVFARSKEGLDPEMLQR